MTLDYMKGDGTPREQEITVPPSTRNTVAVEDFLGEGNGPSYDFSCRVHGRGTVVVERPVYFDCRDGCGGGHAVAGTNDPASEWYFAEGSCRNGFDSYLCIQNPGGEKADVAITYMLGDGTTRNQEVGVDEFSRETVNVADFLGRGDGESRDFSAEVRCTNGQGIVCERPVYFVYRQGEEGYSWSGGHDAMGFNR